MLARLTWGGSLPDSRYSRTGGPPTLVVAIIAPDTAPTATVAAAERRPVYFQPVHISTTKATMTAETAVTMVFLSTLARSQTPSGMAAQAAMLMGVSTFQSAWERTWGNSCSETTS